MGDFDDKERLDDAYRKRVTNTKTGGSFAILRTAKITTMGNMSGSLQHTFRERETLNADSERRRDNQVLIGPDNSKEILQRWHDRAPDKIRKNAVRGIEYLVTGSPEAMAKMSPGQQNDYFAEALDWLKDKHGAENILSAVIHRDETTPHLSAMVIPIDDRGKLNAREFLGGRDKLSQMQTDFAERVGREHGLERGIQGTKSKHKTIKSYYADLEQLPRTLARLPERDKSGFMGRSKETDGEYTERASEALKTALRSQMGHFLRKTKDLETERDQCLALARGYKDQPQAMQESTESQMRGQRVLYLDEIQKIEKERDGLKVAVRMLPSIQRDLSILENKPYDLEGNTAIIFGNLQTIQKHTNLSEEVQKEITDRLKKLGWKEPVRETTKATPEKEQPTPSKDRDTGRER